MKIDKDLFLKKYKLEEEFKRSQLSWPVLEEIYLDYNNKHHEKVEIEPHALINKLYEILDKMNDVDRTKIDTIFGRAKNPEHLIEKIIRKVALENKEKYRTISKEKTYSDGKIQ